MHYAVGAKLLSPRQRIKAAADTCRLRQLPPAGIAQALRQEDTEGPELQKIKEWHNVDRSVFENEILPGDEPAVMKALFRDWPAVEASTRSPADIAGYLKQFDAGGAVNGIVGAPQIDGRFFYSDDLKGFNFEQRRVTVSAALDTLVSLVDAAEPPAIALQAIPVAEVLPKFLDDNPMPLLNGRILPRIWLGNRTRIATHFDNNHNIACVVSGSRRFTVFPPDQVANLYIGPLLRTPGGSPISMVDLRAPDYSAFPKFRDALESAQEALLEPGDAIFIPILWWHGVESLGPLNILVNYWWNDAESVHDKPFLSLAHSMLLLSRLPAAQRDAWRAMFDHFVFQTHGESGAHLPADVQDLQRDLTPEERDQVKALLAKHLKP